MQKKRIKKNTNETYEQIYRHSNAKGGWLYVVAALAKLPPCLTDSLSG